MLLKNFTAARSITCKNESKLKKKKMITHIYSIWIVVLLVTNYLMKRFLELKMTKKIDQKLLKKNHGADTNLLTFFSFFPSNFFPPVSGSGSRREKECGSMRIRMQSNNCGSCYCNCNCCQGFIVVCPHGGWL